MKSWIYLIKEIEDITGDLYLAISEKTENIYPEVSGLFHQLHKEEVHHSNQAEFITTLFNESDNAFCSDEQSGKILSDKIRFIEDVKKVIEEKEMYLHPVDLLKIAIELEEELGEGHDLISERVSDPEVKQFLASLVLEDKIHTKRIKDFLEDYEKNIPVLKDTE